MTTIDQTADLSLAIKIVAYVKEHGIEQVESWIADYPQDNEDTHNGECDLEEYLDLRAENLDEENAG